ncbi:hypothetical protein COCCADRAFT_6931 [Bipolaris zeicola 26-R-13]|uniref:NACHT domain-containing protein n=1 Tax=Cochliobolus carbonum (strain 26-R-13) TaxID=930089 RepID=W6XZF1_COCC2|nr:uncharacterized protein COCCADRAFT_6931 [Bipolaris zeicola 26-R-13]EUC31138.1 hypothetical protein COCCADRAFT_6931 [Bipolaris zeicola 26-R-13]
MDPFTAVGLAGNVVQFVDFACKLFSEARELKTSMTGQSAAQLELQTTCNYLNTFTRQLSTSHFDANPQNLASGEKAIVDLAASCKSTADELLALLQKLQVKQYANHRSYQSFLQAVRGVWKKSKIEELQRRLDSHRRDLTLGLAHSLGDRQSTINVQLRALKEANMRMELNQTQMLDRLSKEISAIAVDATQAQAALTREGSAIKAEDLKAIGDALTSLVDEGRYLTKSQKVLSSLYFKSMKTRHSNVASAHAQTFDWVFRPTSQKSRHSRPPVHFLDWLSHKNGIFWVSGKPGSGKSTLMKHICGHRRTRQTLKLWAKAERCITAKYFFWSAGSTMQKSLKGLLQSLLFDIFKQCPEVISVACPGDATAWEAQMKEDESWDFSDLSNMVRRITHCKEMAAKFCFFIDGLDEYDGRHFDVIKVLDNLAKSPNIKICVSSRPWNIFEDAYGHDVTRKLYLQDLTRQDIKVYVKHRFDKYFAQLHPTPQDKRFKELLEEITNKAQGVFLWVLLVVNSLLEGLTNGDSIALLFSRLRRLPTDLEAFFGHMLNSIDSIYHEHMARSFQIALAASTPLTLMAYSFLDEEMENGKSALERPVKPMDNYELSARHQQMRRRLNGQTKGLLEARQDPAGTDYFGYRVDFLHRTVHDFLRTNDMQKLLAGKTKAGFNPELSILRGYLVLLKAMPLSQRRVTDQSGPVQQLLEEAFFYAREIEIRTKSANRDLIDEFGAVIEAISKETGQDFVWYRDSAVGDYDCVGDKVRKAACSSFFEYTIQKGLQVYVEQKLQADADIKLPGGRPMLDCALRICPSKFSGEIELLDMVRYLLESGADPNEMYGDCSIWGRFLLQISHLPSGRRPPQDVSSALHRHRLIELLLHHGADVNVTYNDNPLFADYIMFVGNHRPSEEIEQIHLQTIDLFISRGPDLCAKLSKRISLLGQFFMYSIGRRGTATPDFRCRMWKYIMPLDEEDEESLAKCEPYMGQIQFLDSKWQQRQKLREEKMSNNQTSMVKASYKWVDWMLSWVWIGV